MTDTAVNSDTEACAPSATHAIGTEAATTVAGALKALADPLRLRMLSAIAIDPRGESCVCDLAELAELSQPTVSHHLKVLKETGMLLSERRGTWVYYRIAPARRGAVTALLDAFAPAATLDTVEDDATRVEALQTMDARVTRLAEELADELTGLNRDLVVAIVRESYAGLVRSAKLTAHMIPLTERFARQRLADLTRDRNAGVPQVLFVCVANAGRSQLAARSGDREPTRRRQGRRPFRRVDAGGRCTPACEIAARRDRRRSGSLHGVPEAADRRRGARR